MKTGVRISYLALALVAFITSIVAQVVAALAIELPIIIITGVQAVMQGITEEAVVLETTMAAVNKAMPMIIVVTHLMLLSIFGIWYARGCKHPQKPSLRNVDFKAVFTHKNVSVMVMVAAGMCFFTNFAMPIASMIVPENVMAAYEELMESAGFGESVLPTIAAILIAPFGEELIFRGVTFYYAKKAVSDFADKRKAFWIANCIQALGFGVFHMNLVQGTYAFIMGLVLGYLAHRFGTLLPAMLGHMIINGLSSFAWNPIVNLLPESYVVYGIGALISLMIVFAGLYLGGPAEKKQTLEIEEA